MMKQPSVLCDLYALCPSNKKLTSEPPQGMNEFDWLLNLKVSPFFVVPWHTKPRLCSGDQFCIFQPDRHFTIQRNPTSTLMCVCRRILSNITHHDSDSCSLPGGLISRLPCGRVAMKSTRRVGWPNGSTSWQRTCGNLQLRKRKNHPYDIPKI